MNRVSRWLPLTILVWLSVLTGQADERSPEASVKAAVITNLPLFIRWPEVEGNGAPATELCVVGNGETARLLSQYLLPPWRLRKFTPLQDEVRDCAMLFVEGDDPGAVFRAAAAIGNRPVLLVAETPRAIDKGAMISLSAEGRRLMLDINLIALKRSGLTARAKLLRLARTVAE